MPGLSALWGCGQSGTTAAPEANGQIAPAVAKKRFLASQIGRASRRGTPACHVQWLQQRSSRGAFRNHALCKWAGGAFDKRCEALVHGKEGKKNRAIASH